MDKKKVSDPRVLYQRYEGLKKKYFQPQRPDSDDYIAPITRGQIISQFEQMGCEIPMTPDQPFTPLPARSED